MADNQTGFSVTADINPFEQSMRRLVDAAKEGQLGVGSALGALAGGPLAGLKTAFEGIASVLAGGLFAAAIKDTADMTEKTMDLSRALGISTNEAKAIQMAMEDIGAQTGEYEAAAKGMTRQLKDNEESMNKMGLRTRDAAGNLRPLNDLVMDGVKTLGDYKEGTDRALASQALFGRGIDASSRLMLYNADTLEQNKQAMADLGLEVGANAVAAWGEYDSATDRAHFGMQGLKKAIGESLMPVMTSLVNMLNAAMPAAITVVRGALSGLTTLFLAVKNGVVIVVESIQLSLYSILEPLRGLTEAMGRAMLGDFSGASAAFMSIGKNVSDTWAGSMARMTESSETTARQISALFEKDLQAGSGGGPGQGNKNYTSPKEKPAQVTKEPSQMPVYEAELSKRIALFEREAQAQGTLRQYSKADEAAYWKEVTTLATISAEDKARAEKKWRDLERGLRTEAFTVEMATLEQSKQDAQNNYTARIALATQAHDKTVAMYGAESKEAAATYGKILDEKRKLVQQVQQLDDMAAQRRRDKALGDIEFDRQDAEHQLAMGAITQEQLLVQQAQFEERMHAIKLQYLQQAQAAIDPQKDPVKKAEIDAQIEQLELQHQLRMGQIKNQISAQAALPANTIAKSMESSFDQAMIGILTRAQTLQQSLSNIFANVYTVFLQEMVTKPLAMSAVRVIRETAMYKMLSGVQVGAQAAASGAVVGIKAGETTAVVGANATEAATGAAASQAAIPVIGPMLAMAAAAAMMSFVMGQGNKGGTTTTSTRIPSASAGFDIPKGLNPLTQLHQEEMVLPAHIANPLRESLAQGDMGSGAGQGGGDINIHINATDAQSVARLFRDNGQHLVSALQQQRRNFGF